MISDPMIFQPAIGGVRFVDMYDFPFHVAKLRKFFVTLHHGREK